MGRPLKIAKAQAVLTITGTATNGTITVTDNLITAPNVGVMSGMPFMVASTVGGLTANVTYYVLAITGNNTFTASSTQLSVQPRTYPTLSNTSGGSVKASVGVVDAWFNNPVGGAGFPATNANTYGVVGGNTAIIGKQVLCNVAFGVNGTGTLYANTATASVVGTGTDFGNLATGSHLYAVSPTDGSLSLLGTSSATKGNLTIAITSTAATGNVITTDGAPTGNALLLTINTPVKFDDTFGNLTAGTTYWVKTTPNADAFTVSATLGGAPVQLTNDVTGTQSAYQDRVLLGAVSAADAVGTSFVQALPEAGYIVRQKGKTKYLVTGTVTTITAPVYTANVANTALTPNTMSIIGTYAGPSTKFMRTVNDYQSEAFPATVAPGSLVTGTLYTIYESGTTNWTSVGAASNITGVTFAATGTASGTGTAVLNTVNPDVISTFNTASAANTFPGQPNPIVTINGV